jgi:pyrroloquinoline quinone biosynthesis protein D
MTRPRLADGARLQYDDVREEHVLLIPEGAVRLNETAAQVLEQIAATLSARYQGADVAGDVRELVDAMRERGLVVDAAA